MQNFSFLYAFGYLLFGAVIGLVVAKRATLKTTRVATMLLIAAVVIAILDVLALYLIRSGNIQVDARSSVIPLVLLVLYSTNAIAGAGLTASIGLLACRKEHIKEAGVVLALAAIPVLLLVPSFAADQVTTQPRHISQVETEPVNTATPAVENAAAAVEETVSSAPEQMAQD